MAVEWAVLHTTDTNYINYRLVPETKGRKCLENLKLAQEKKPDMDTACGLIPDSGANCTNLDGPKIT